MENTSVPIYNGAKALGDPVEAPMYEPVKAAQIIAYFALRSHERTINVLKAIKLVYIAQREHLKRYGLPMLDEPLCALPHGPVNSYTYDRVKQDALPASMAQVLGKAGQHSIIVHDNIEEWHLEELSDGEVATLNRVWNMVGDLDHWQLRDWTHDPQNVPEWKDPAGSSLPITLETMIEAVGLQNAAEHARLLRQHYAIERRLKH